MKNLLIAMAIGLISVGCCNNQPTQQTECCDENCNKVIETIMARRSVRAYKNTPVEKELLDKVLECGINAPNALNAQQWEVRVVMSQEWINMATEVAKATAKGTSMEAQYSDPSFKNIFRNAPVVIFIGHKPSAYTPVDCGLMAGNMMLAAKSLGLGTVCMAGPIRTLQASSDGVAYLRSLGFSEGYEPLLCRGIGYPDEEPAAKARNRDVIKYVE